MTTARRVGARRPNAAPTGSFTVQTVRFSQINVPIFQRETLMIKRVLVSARKSAAVAVCLVLCAALIAGTNRVRAFGTVLMPVDCQKHQLHMRVRSSVDRQVYIVDVCAVADSSEGMDFRIEEK